MDNLVALLSYLVITSVAAERFTEIIKKTLIGKFVTNSVVYQITSALFGGAMGYFNPPVITSVNLSPIIAAVIVGLAVSGGSGVWSDLLGMLKDYRNNIKQLNLAK